MKCLKWVYKKCSGGNDSLCKVAICFVISYRMYEI